MRIVIVQFGDYREGFLRLAAGGPETYHDQKFTVDFVSDLALQADHLSVISCGGDRHDEILSNGVHAIGLPLWKTATEMDLLARVQAARPTHLIARSPLRKVLNWALRAGIQVLPMLADSFRGRTLRERYSNFRLRRTLNHRGIAVIGNHNLPASRSLKEIGVDPWKIVPFDYESRWQITPEQSESKSCPSSKRPVRVAYVGQVIPEKGVGDMVDAMPRLRSQGLNVHLTIVGKGELETYRDRARALGVSEAINFTGLIPHNHVIPMMRLQDLVVVPTRHEFGEGMPGTIYEGLCARTPLLISDHPVFLKRFRDRRDVMVFRAGDPGDLANRIFELMANSELYESLSANSLEAWRLLQVPVGWGALIQSFLRNQPSDRQWLRDYSLASGRYDAM